MIENGRQVLIAINGGVQYAVVVATVSRLNAGVESNTYTVVYRDQHGTEHEESFAQDAVCEVRAYNTQENIDYLRDNGGGVWAKNKAREVSEIPTEKFVSEAMPAVVAGIAPPAANAEKDF